MRVATYALIPLLVSLTSCTSSYFPLSHSSDLVGSWRSVAIHDTTDHGPKIGWEIDLAENDWFSLLTDRMGIQDRTRGRYSTLGNTVSFDIPYRHEPWALTFRFIGDTLVLTDLQPNLNLAYSVYLLPSDSPIVDLHKLPQMPTTVQAAASIIDSELDEESKNLLLYEGKRAYAWMHMGYGTFIRNRFGLWGHNPELIEACGNKDPDEAWTVILDTLVGWIRRDYDSTLIRCFDLQNEMITLVTLNMTPINRTTLSQALDLINQSCDSMVTSTSRFSDIRGFRFRLADSVVADSMVNIDFMIEHFQYMPSPTTSVPLKYFINMYLYPTFRLSERRDRNSIWLTVAK